ncbi:c6 transcription factor [Trichoderma arundinaceum]|uniref:C6 transcription factor n=1 Tax=Trichoderma arundinaceum TaxID=490622 RepID=A0A395P0V1_TRIAR|nr:c6 transcription factor [Trichoderma arundinaceum]
MPEQITDGSPLPLRRVLPASARRSPSATARRSTASAARQNMVPAACNACRKQKTKCSGERPTCRRCAQRRADCQYTTEPGETVSQAIKRGYKDLRYRTSVHGEFFDLLKNLPEQEAQHVFQRIRAGADVTTILNHVRAGNLLLQMAVQPETRFRYEFPYRSEMPSEYIVDNPYLESIIFGAASLYPTGQQSLPSPHTASSLGDDVSEEYQSVYLKPFHAAHVIDARLSNAKISAWTAVSTDDVLMRDLLGVFLRCEYHLSAAFQKDFFLEDLVSRRKDFCSSLLVNVVLAYACVCYPGLANRAEYWNPDTLLYRFVAEAKRLWELEADEPRITTIQAGIIFNVFYNLCGLDEVGQVYRIHAVDLAHQLRLFDAPADGWSVDARSERLQKGKAFAAWALFNWETLVGFSFVHAPLLKEPPSWPLPDPTQDTQCIYYHHLILTLYEPVVDIQTNQEPSPRQIVYDSKKRLQTLVRLYYLRHGFDAMDLFLVIPLMLTGSDCIDSINEQTPQSQLETLRSTLMLVATGLYSQRRNHYLAEALFRVIRGRMRPPEVSLLRDTMSINEKEWDDRRDMVQAVRSHWPVSVIKKKEDVDFHNLTNLVENYAHLNIEDTPSAVQDAQTA